MDLWYSRPESPGSDFRVKVRRPLFSAESGERRLDVLETEDFGRLLLVDGRIVLAENDGAAYREMAVHVPLNAHPGVRSVLVAGGGDGSVVAELVRYPEVERIVVAEPDDGVVEAARRWFPGIAASLRDPRVRLVAEEAAGFARETKERFDLVIVDRPDDEGKAELGQAFYCDCFRILSGDGILVNRAGSATFPGRRRDLVRSAGRLKRLFPVYRLYRVSPPAGEPGELLLGFASKRYEPSKGPDEEAWEKRGIATSYYNAALHGAAFALPQYAQELLESV
ncbi:MAG TPA: spermidine synthase [Spirochaetia bacterium]|nr:spermidine synthase [Spirochaetia bacterium]